MNQYCPHCKHPLSANSKGELVCHGFYMGDQCDFSTADSNERPLSQDELDDLQVRDIIERLKYFLDSFVAQKQEEAIADICLEWLKSKNRL